MGVNASVCALISERAFNWFSSCRQTSFVISSPIYGVLHWVVGIHDGCGAT